MSENFLDGELPSELGSLGLSRLFVNDNVFSGTIPSQLSALTDLTVLRAGNNRFDATDVQFLFGLTSAREIHLEAANLTGSISEEIGSLVQLTSLRLNGNSITGSLPPAIGNLNSLFELYLHENDISGQIPPEVGLLSDLAALRIHTNRFNESIPEEIGGLAALGKQFSRWAVRSHIVLTHEFLPVLLDLHTTFLSGSIPTTITDLVNLGTFGSLTSMR